MASTPFTQNAQTPAPANAINVNDVSHRAHNLARIVDRLSPGTYHVTIIKDAIKGADWNIEIVRSELIQRVSLSNKNYISE